MAIHHESDYGHSLPLTDLTSADIVSLAKFSGGVYHSSEDPEEPGEIHFITPEGLPHSKILFSAGNVSLYEPDREEPVDMKDYMVVPFEDRIIFIAPDQQDTIYVQEGKITHQ